MCSSTLEGEPRPVQEDTPVVEVPIADHLDAVRAHHRFKDVVRGGKAWDLSHLDPFAFRVDPGLGFEVIVRLHESGCVEAHFFHPAVKVEK